MIGIDFEYLIATVPVCQVLTSSRPAAAVEISPRLGGPTTPANASIGEFDEEIDKLHGFQRAESKLLRT
jgi:hypothetical protein